MYNKLLFKIIFLEKLAAPSTQTSPITIPYAARAEIKTENIQPESSKGKLQTFLSAPISPNNATHTYEQWCDIFDLYFTDFTEYLTI